MEKEPVTVRIATGRMERLRNAIWHIGKGLTVNGLFEAGLEEVLQQLESKYNEGNPFPVREGELPRSPKGKTSQPTIR